MKKIFNKIKSNILLYDLIFTVVIILINFILYLVNLRFRLWFIIIIILICAIGFIIGIFQQFFKSSENKKIAVIMVLLIFSVSTIIIIILMPFITFVFAFSYKPEHTVILDNKKYVAVVSSFLNVDVDYYDYYGPLLMGTKIRVHGYFGNGGYDPFVNTNIADRVEYTYYDENGKTKLIRTEIFIRDNNDNIIDKIIYEDDVNKTDEFNENDNYLLPENEEVLYENKFDNIILRVGRIDYVSGKNMLVNVLKSNDSKNFYVVSEEAIQVSNEAKFTFLAENLGFIISTDKIDFDSNKSNLYVTNNGGKTFMSSNFKYKNNNVSYLNIDGMPYYEDNSLKLKCSVYEINQNKDGYEEKTLIFISNDNGLNWILENS